MAYDLGDTAPLGVTILNASQVPVTPSTISLTITLPDGTTTSPTPTTGATGVYTYDYVTVQAGRHLARWLTTVPGTAFTDAFDVAEAAAPLILSLADAKSFLNITDTTNDEELREFVAGVTAVIEGQIGAVVRRSVTTTVYPNGSGEVVLPHRHVLSITSAATVAGASVDITGWIAEDGIIRTTTGVWPTTPYVPWTVTYVVGRTIIPANVLMAAKEILKQAWASQRGGDVPAFLIPYRAQAWLQPEPDIGFA